MGAGVVTWGPADEVPIDLVPAPATVLLELELGELYLLAGMLQAIIGNTIAEGDRTGSFAPMPPELESLVAKIGAAVAA